MRVKKLLPSELEAALALGEVKLRTGDARAARAELEAIQTRATQKRLLAIARKASALLNQTTQRTSLPSS